MKTISLEEMQSIELNMLKELKKVCEKHNLRYFIDGGTLLGAYCYNGFIPWDDDIDVKMPRPDYEKLIEYKGEFSSNIRIVHPEDDNYQYSFTKIENTDTIFIENVDSSNEHIGGVYIDILPMDGHPKSDFNKHRLERYKTLFHVSKNGFSKTLKGKIYGLLYTPKRVYRKLTKLAKHFDYDRSEYVGLVIEGDFEKEKFSRLSLDKYVELKFCDDKFPASCDYEKHLAKFYGEHVLKAECKGNLPKYPTGHTYKAYWKDKNNK